MFATKNEIRKKERESKLSGTMALFSHQFSCKYPLLATNRNSTVLERCLQHTTHIPTQLNASNNCSNFAFLCHKLQMNITWSCAKQFQFEVTVTIKL